MKRLIVFIVVSLALALLLAFWRPRHVKEDISERPSPASPAETVDVGSATASSDRTRSAHPALAPAADEARVANTDISEAEPQESNAKAPAPTGSSTSDGRHIKSATQGERPDLPILPVPTVAQMEGTLAVPLAFLEPSAEIGLTDEQAAGLAEIARQFNRSVSAVGQDPTDPVYAKVYYDAQKLADEQVYASYGQDVYTALLNQRAQAAGNAPPGQ